MAMKAMKAMKAKKAMKAMKAMTAMKMAKKKSVVGKKASVLKGTKVRTAGGLKKSDLMISKSGKVVSKKSSAAGKKAYKHIKSWNVAVQKARKALGVKGFVAVKKGTALYKK